MKDEASQILEKYWGYTGFRYSQEAIITNILSGLDVIGVLPTGAGKSLCYQVPGMCLPGLTLVISPLIALMKDQIHSLKARKIKASGLFSGQYRREQDIILDNAVYGDQKFLFVSPERLKTEIFIERVKKMNVSLIAVDEAHCISEWGHDFRPEYRRIAEIRQLLPEVTMIALTATATVEVIEDIVENLELRDPERYIHSPVRKNLSYNVLNTEAKKEYLAQYIKNTKGSKIIYVNTRKQSKEIERLIKERGINCKAFHGGMNQKERETIISAWNANEVKVMVATKAFGMGIDKPDVRLVLHHSPPQTLESYVQEAGRAGRDGNTAHSITLYNRGDLAKLHKKIEETYPSIDFLKEIYKKVCQYLKVAQGPCQTEFYPFYLEKFCQNYELPKFKTFNALKNLHKFEIVYLSEAILHPSRLRLRENNVKVLLSNPNLSPKMKAFIQVLLRSYEGLFLDYTVIDEHTISRKNNLQKNQIISALQWLQKRAVADYLPSYQGHTISFREYRYNSEEIPVNQDLYKRRKAALVESIKSMENFLQTSKCRQLEIASYFGFEEEDCRVCDNCTHRYEAPSQTTIMQRITEHLSAKELSLIEIYSKFPIGIRADIKEALTHMEAEREIALQSGKLKLIG